MEKILCFVLGWNELYLEQVLVWFNEIPLFFICKDHKGAYYLALFADMEEWVYWVVEISPLKLSYLLHERMTMQEAFTTQQYFWEVFAGEEIESDRSRIRSMETIDKSLLPKEGAYYKVLNKEVRKYVEKFEEERGRK